MNMINLDDAVVMYEGQKLPVKALMKTLQDQLRDAANRLNSIAFVLDGLFSALENSKVVEVRATLSQTQYETFKLLDGQTDQERICRAVQLLSEKSLSVVDELPNILDQPDDFEKADEPFSITPLLQPEADEPVGRKKSVTRCPRCKNPLNIPDTPADQWPVEVKCGSCGAKCLIKSKTNTSRSDRSGLESMDETVYGNLLDMLSP